MRNKREDIRRALVLILAVGSLTICAAPVLAQTGALRANGKIAFTSDRDGNREIYVMNADGTNQIRLTNNSVVDDHPTWSPDGTKIAFVSQRPDGGFAIFTMNADGTTKTEVTPIITNPIWDWSMSWSPDGNRIVFQEPTDGKGYVNDIFIVNIDGSNRHVLMNGPEDERQPAWSPDGSRILFSKEVSPVLGSKTLNLYTVKPDGSDLRGALAPSAYLSDIAPSWSPTGDKIAFTIFDWANFNSIGIANADGSNRQTFDDGNPSPSANRDKPHWSPDGSKIVFSVQWTDTQIYVKNVDGTGLTKLTSLPGNNLNPSWQSLASAACAYSNPIDCADFFVRQHYQDFLNREPDADGLAFWTSEITGCGTDSACVEVKRINVSAAFFLSIEFQQTGYLAYRIYKASYGDATGTSTSGGTHQLPVPVVRLNEFLTDTQAIGQGVIVGQTGWEQVLENNKQAFTAEFVQRSRFTTAFPQSMTAAQFVDTLNANAGSPLSQSERDQLVSDLTMGTKTRAQVLRAVAEDRDLYDAEFNRAFVLMQYFGYLRRNPNDPQDADYTGYDFWLNKLNGHNGNFVSAEMVKSFLISGEYRQRFGP